MMQYKKEKESQLSFESDKSSNRIKTTRIKARRLFKKRNELKIVLDDSDVTPSALKILAMYNPSTKQKKSQSQMDVLRSQVVADGMFASLASAAVLQSHLQSVTMSYSAATAVASIVSVIKTDDDDFSRDILETGSLFKVSEEELREPDNYTLKKEQIMPARANIVLTETPVFYLYETASETAEKDTEEGNQVEKDNVYYEYLTLGKGKNRKTTNAEIQTATHLLKSRYTHVERCKRQNNHAFASNWDMFDTYKNNVSIKRPNRHLSEVLTNLEDPKYQQDLEQQMVELIKKAEFQNKVIIMERILANNVYNQEQKRFRGLTAQDPFRPDIEFRYSLELLWTFKNDFTGGHPVTSMHWNPSNKDVLAVGYGKFFYSDNKNGFVYCWNIKNPTQPEREYYYDHPVTAVAFSTFDPNLIAVGLYDGLVNVLDISTKDVKVIYTTVTFWSQSHEPIWQLTWLPPDDYHPNEEYLVCVTEDGRICRLIVAKTNELVAHPLMRVIPIEGKIKGVYQARHCPVTDVPISKCAAALLITKNMADNDTYYIGTDEGTIHQCSRNYLNQHISMFLAHNGPVYSCEFSHFCNKLFLTCGADWCTNIWAVGITEPLITLTKSMEAVEGAAWNPANSTIIANIAGNEIILWDIQRRTYLPASVHKSPTNCRNTLIQFTDSGKNLVVADIEGNVHIFALEDMPFPPFYQSEMLTQVVKKTLETRKDLVAELNNIGSLHH